MAKEILVDQVARNLGIDTGEVMQGPVTPESFEQISLIWTSLAALGAADEHLAVEHVKLLFERANALRGKTQEILQQPENKQTGV